MLLLCSKHEYISSRKKTAGVWSRLPCLPYLSYFSLLFLIIILLYLLEYVQYFELNAGQFLAVIEETLVAFASHGFHVKSAAPYALPDVL